ncbi:MAG: ABC transporter substrate-binding protein, partial [Planctomycetota bacterium]
MKRGIGVALLLGLVVVLVVVFGGRPTRIVYAGSAWYGHAPVWVGIRRGIFRKHGFEVQKEAFGGSADRINALEAGNAVFASLGEVAMLAAMARDRRGFYWVGCHNIASGNEGLVGVGVHSIGQLKGKKVALYQNTSIHLTIALLLKEAGLDIRRDVEVLNAQDSAVVDLVRRGDAAAGGMWEPFYTRLRNLPGARVLGTDQDTSVYRDFKMMTGPDVLCASKRWVDADPERARRFFRAYFEAVEWCNEHPEELVRIVLEVTRTP